jgi:hypothetical protein
LKPVMASYDNVIEGASKHYLYKFKWRPGPVRPEHAVAWHELGQAGAWHQV